MNPVMAVENFCSAGVGWQFPDHTITANEEATGSEVERVADGRRGAADKWTPTTANSAAYVNVACDRTRAANFIALDRGHNLAGYDLELRGSQQSAFTTYETVLDITLPSATAAGNIDDALGVRTEEGAWFKRFDLNTYQYWRVHIPAMGASLKPEIVGLWLGLCYAPDYFDKPWGEDGAELIHQETQSPSGWAGRGVANKQRSGVVQLSLSTFEEYDHEARYHVQGLYGEGFPMWIAFDETQADRAVLAELPLGRLAFSLTGTWGYRSAAIPWREREPLRP